MNRLMLLRKEKGLRQADLAKEIGCTQATLSGWETGKFEIASNYLIKLCKVLDCTADDILGLNEPVLVNDDPELTEYLEQLKNRPEMRMLFSLTKTATKKDVEKAVEIIEAYLRK